MKAWEAIPAETCFRCRQPLAKYYYVFNGMVFCSGFHKECREHPVQTPKTMCGKPSLEEAVRIEAFIIEKGYRTGQPFDRYNMNDRLAARICPGRDPKSTRRIASTISKRLKFEPWKFAASASEDMLNYEKIKEVLG